MWKNRLKNHTFDWMGERYAPFFDSDHFLGHSPIGNTKWNLPPVNVSQKDDRYVMEIFVPGFKKEELEVIADDDILTVRGEQQHKSSEKKDDYIIEEFDNRHFERRFRLANGIGHEKIEAKYEDGVLKIYFKDVPKAEERQFQKIEVS